MNTSTLQPVQVLKCQSAQVDVYPTACSQHPFLCCVLRVRFAYCCVAFCCFFLFGVPRNEPRYDPESSQHLPQTYSKTSPIDPGSPQTQHRIDSKPNPDRPQIESKTTPRLPKYDTEPAPNLPRIDEHLFRVDSESNNISPESILNLP